MERRAALDADGGLIALASQARANILVFMAVYPLFAAWRWWRLREWAGLLPLLGLLGAFGMMIPWGIVNTATVGPFSSDPQCRGREPFLGQQAHRRRDGAPAGTPHQFLR